MFIVFIFFIYKLKYKVKRLKIRYLPVLRQEWQARQREKTKELHRRRQEEDEEEDRKVEEYREIGMRLKGFPEEDVRNARKLVSSFIRAAEEVEEVTNDWQQTLCFF